MQCIAIRIAFVVLGKGHLYDKKNITMQFYINVINAKMVD